MVNSKTPFPNTGMAGGVDDSDDFDALPRFVDVKISMVGVVFEFGFAAVNISKRRKAVRSLGNF